MMYEKRLEDVLKYQRRRKETIFLIVSFILLMLLAVLADYSFPFQEEIIVDNIANSQAYNFLMTIMSLSLLGWLVYLGFFMGRIVGEEK